MGALDLFVAALLASGVMLATGCLTQNAARKSVKWEVITTIAAAFGISAAMEQSGVAGEIAVRELLADVTSEALSKYPNTLEKDREIAASDPTKPAGKQAKKQKSFLAELRGPSEGELAKFPDADAWVGVFPEPVRQT